MVIGLLLLATSCSDNEDALENSIDFSSPYVIQDDPNDPIQHHRYLIFEEYGVPVFFNDTVSEKYIGQTYDGRPIYRYETLDLNWSFTSHNKNSVTYSYEYITDPQIQETALQFVDEFLKEASKPMRPFSIFLTGTLKITSQTGTKIPDFHTGFRTLVIPNVQDVLEEDIPAFTRMILKAMVKDRVMNNESIVSDFGSISGKENYYGKSWVDDLKCKWGVEHRGVYWDPSKLYNRGIENQYVSESYGTNVHTIEEFRAERDLIFQQIGRYGFICGNYSDNLGHKISPKNAKEELEFYLDQMLAIGSKKFEERYCSSASVMDKYTILADYINDVLAVEF